MSDQRLLRRRVMGGKDVVATPTITPPTGEYVMSGRFDCTISCSTPNSTIHYTVYDKYWVVLGSGTIPTVVDGGTPSGTVNISYSIGMQETRIVRAYATRPYWIDSAYAQTEYFNSDAPDAPVIRLFGCPTGDGNSIHTEIPDSSNSCYTPTYVTLTDPLHDSSSVIYYTIDGSTPSSSSSAYDKNTDKVQWSNSTDLYNNSIPYKYYITSPGTYTVKAIVKIGSASSAVATRTFTVTQSTITNQIVVHSDDTDSAGNWMARDIQNQYPYLGMEGGEWFSTTSSPPDTYGFGVLVDEGDHSNDSTIKYSADSSSSTPSNVLSNGLWISVNRCFYMKFSITKFGCTTVTSNYGLLRVNRFAVRVNVTSTDISNNRAIFIGRLSQWVDGSNRFGQNYGEWSDADTTGYSGSLHFSYNMPEDSWDNYDPLGSGDTNAVVRVYMRDPEGKIYRLRDSDLEEDTMSVILNECTQHNDTSGTEKGQWQNSSEFDLQNSSEIVKVYVPQKAGAYEFIYSYPEKLRIKLSSTNHKWCTINSPYGVLSTMFHEIGGTMYFNGDHNGTGRQYLVPNEVAVTSGMTTIPAFFMSNIRATAQGDMQIRFNEQGFLNFSVSLPNDGSSTVKSIGNYAFSNCMPQYSNGAVNIDLSSYTQLTNIGKYVFFGCTSSGSWLSTSARINMMILPSSLKQIGLFFCGFNWKTGNSSLPAVYKMQFNSLEPPSLAKKPETGSRMYIGGSVDYTKWHYMTFATYHWTGSDESTFSMPYGQRYSPVNTVTVPDAYVCIYNDIWCYQQGTNPAGYSQERVLSNFYPVGTSTGTSCYGTSHEDFPYPGANTPQGRFTFRDFYVSEGNQTQVFTLGNKLCISKGNLTYYGTPDEWRFNDDQWGSRSESENESTAQTSVRDLFAWGTSNYQNGAAKYRPWEFGGNNDSYRPYNSTTANLRGKYANNWTTWTTLADWAHNRIYKSGTEYYEQDYWQTPTKDQFWYILHSRKTRNGYRFAKAKVAGVYGLILFPDNWSSSWYSSLVNINKTYQAKYSANTITSAQWSSNFANHGAVFLPAGGRLNSDRNLVWSDDGYYWFYNVSTTNDQGGASDAYAKALHFDGSYTSNYPLECPTEIQRGQACKVRLVRSDLDYTEATA